jgi:type IV fimbrial biogenesis protein FimT
VLVNAWTHFGACPPGKPACARGFTLVELVVVVTMFGIGAAVVMPAMRNALVQQRVRASATDLMSSLLLARSEAIKRNAQVSVTPHTAWANGWDVTAVDTGDAIEHKAAPGDGVSFGAAPDVLTYNGNGRPGTTGVVKFEIDAATSSQLTRCITIDPAGLPRLFDGSCA